jgi:two-component system sensor histidine kinase KdpD
MLVICIVAGTCYSLSSVLPYRVTALILLVTVSLIAMFFDIAPVMAAAVLSALLWDFFFIPPYFKFAVGNSEDALMLVMYFVIATLNAVLTYKIRQVEKSALREEGRANTIQLYNTLLNSLSHELRTPIAAIIGASDNLSEPQKLTEQSKSELVGEISKASFRLNQQVENLLNMSRLESGVIHPHKNWCDISELIYAAVNKLEPELKNHAVKVHVPERFPLFKLDFGLMERVIFNLLNNAAVYTPQSSEIVVAARAGREVKSTGSIIETVSDELILTVEDNGRGFPAEEIENVFEKFYRLKNSRTGGTGLGLSIVQGFVKAHQGTVRLENIAGGGAKFTIVIPAEVSEISSLKNE